MATRLKKYTTGTFSGFLNMPTNISLDNNLIVFGIRDMEEELRPIAMYSILNHIWTSVRRVQKKRLLIVDEAWWLMKYEIGADFLSNIAKRARKYYLLETRVGFGLFFVGQNHVGIRVVASYAEDQIITSDPKQILEIEKAKEEWAKLRS